MHAVAVATGPQRTEIHVPILSFFRNSSYQKFSRARARTNLTSLAHGLVRPTPRSRLPWPDRHCDCLRPCASKGTQRACEANSFSAPVAMIACATKRAVGGVTEALPGAGSAGRRDGRRKAVAPVAVTIIAARPSSSSSSSSGWPSSAEEMQAGNRRRKFDADARLCALCDSVAPSRRRAVVPRLGIQLQPLRPPARPPARTHVTGLIELDRIIFVSCARTRA